MDKKTLEGIRDYAAAEPSDPFVLARALAHVRNGLASVYWDDERNSYIDARYSATAHVEERKTGQTEMHPEGSTYHVTVYRNRVRP